MSNNGAVIVQMYHSFWEFQVPITVKGTITTASGGGVNSVSTVQSQSGLFIAGLNGNNDEVQIANTNITANRSQLLQDRAGTLGVLSSLQTESLTADDTAITVTSTTLLIQSDNATATNRTFTLATTGIVEGQPLTILFDDGTNQAELQSTTNNLTIGGATITFNAVGQLVDFKFVNGKWRQVSALVASS